MNITREMLDAHLAQYIRHWDEDIDWTEAELVPIQSKLRQMALLNQAAVHMDQPLNPEDYLAFFNDCVTAALGTVMRAYAASSGPLTQPELYRTAGTSTANAPQFTFLTPETYVPKLDINQAQAQQLEELPGIGASLAKKIIALRSKTGRIQDLEELIAIKGISADMVASFRYRVTLGRPDCIAFIAPALATFVRHPSFANYITLIKKTNGVFVTNAGQEHSALQAPQNSDIKEIIGQELDKCLRFLRRSTTRSGMFGTTAGSIKAYSRARRIAHTRESCAATDISGVSILDDTQYMFFLQEALARAVKKIYVIMFFMRFEDEKAYPTDACIDLLLQAHKKGFDVKVILDKDAEGDTYNSRIINKEAYDFFKKNGVPVVHDAELYVTHSKLVIIDDAHTIIGSHNWTAGSFYAYDDKSLYVESAQFNATLTGHFQALWDTYHGKVQIQGLKTFSAALKAQLKDKGLTFVCDLLKHLKTKQQRDAFANSLGLEKGYVTTMANMADLMRVDGIDEAMAYLLEKNGVDTVVELAARKADALFNTLTQYKASPGERSLVCRKPLLKHVAHWISKASTLKRTLEY